MLLQAYLPIFQLIVIHLEFNKIELYNYSAPKDRILKYILAFVELSFEEISQKCKNIIIILLQYIIL